jgi:hypothetical protein
MTDTSLYVDPREGMVGVRMAQCRPGALRLPSVVPDFWTSAYQAIDDRVSDGSIPWQCRPPNLSHFATRGLSGRPGRRVGAKFHSAVGVSYVGLRGKRHVAVTVPEATADAAGGQRGRGRDPDMLVRPTARRLAGARPANRA